ncbi:MAG: CPBP family intramembrane metalloprotease [Sedimentisphaerales bacterium]|nr:CPBP family intramembrane metalloprotease [Sedimentisphaerales bacterium]
MNIFENISEILCSVSTEGLFDYLFYLTGFTLLAIWLHDTSFGMKALEKSRLRRNNMPAYLPLVMFFAIFLGIDLVATSATLLSGNLQNSQKVLIDEIVNIIARLVSIGVIVYIIKICFVRGIKGFGLNIKTIPKDFAFALIYLIAILPLMNLLLGAIVFLNELIFSPDYQIPTHQELQTLAENSNITIRFAIAVGTIVVVPFFEEMLFRGLLQTMIRSNLYFYKYAAWIAILMTSVFFAITHANPSHWPVLFVLSMAIGYSYEKSGSLFRPVFMHMLFNGSAIILTWIQ